MSVNKVVLVGRVGKDPELQTLDSGSAVVHFSLATSENWKDKNGERVEKTEWHNIVIWNKLAEVAEQYVKKGDLLYLSGKIQTRSYEKDNVKHFVTEIICNEMRMLGGSSSGSGQSQQQPAPNPPEPDPEADNDLPF